MKEETSPQIENQASLANINPAGWVKIWRSVIEKGWLSDHKLWAVWSYCLLRASHKDHKQMVGRQEVVLQPGQFIFGRFETARELRIKPPTLYKILKRLEVGMNIHIKSNNKFSVITIVNWELYQGKQEDEEHQKEQRSNNKVTTKEHKQECKNEKKKEYSAPSHDVQAAIDYFFQAVQEKKGFAPKIGAKDAAQVKRCLKSQSLDDIKAQIDFFLSNGKSRDHLSLAVALSTDTHNLFQMQKAKSREPLGGLAY